LFSAVAVSAHDVAEAWYARYLTPLSVLHVSVPAAVGHEPRIAFSSATSSLHAAPPSRWVPKLATHSNFAMTGVVVGVVVTVVVGVVVGVAVPVDVSVVVSVVVGVVVPVDVGVVVGEEVPVVV